MLVKPVTLLTPIAATAGRSFTPLVSIDNIGELYDRAGGTLINGRTSTATVVDYQGNVVDCLANEIRYNGARRVDHGDATIYNAGVAGIEYFDTEADGTTPISPAPTLLHEGAATNLLAYSLANTSNDSWLEIISGDGSVTKVSTTELAPDGTNTAIHYSCLSGSSFGLIGGNLSLDYDTQYKFSCWIKSATGSDQVIAFYTNSELGSVTITNQWQRLDKGIFRPSSNPGVFYRWIGAHAGHDVASADFIVWEAQVEEGEYVTSLIHSDGVITSRSADSIKLALAGNINQSSGVALLRFTPQYDSDATQQGLLSFDDSNNSVISDSSTINTLSTTDGTNTAAAGVTWVAGDDLLIATVWNDDESKMVIGVSKNGGAWTWSSDATYDGAFSVGSYINLFYSNAFVCNLDAMRIYGGLPGVDISASKTWVEANAGSLT